MRDAANEGEGVTFLFWGGNPQQSYAGRESKNDGKKVPASKASRKKKETPITLEERVRKRHLRETDLGSHRTTSGEASSVLEGRTPRVPQDLVREEACYSSCALVRE